MSLIPQPLIPQIPPPSLGASVNFDTNETRSLKTDFLESTLLTDGQAILTGGTLSNLDDPILDSDIATKNFIDTLPGSSGTPGGTDQDIQINDGFSNFTGSNNLIWDGSSMIVTGSITDGTAILTGSSLTNLVNPVSNQDAVTKSYVDNITTGSLTQVTVNIP